MPVQSWVEHWLDRYCAPGEHSLQAVRAGVVACSRCGKEELAAGSTCIVCGIPGEHPAVLVNSNGEITRIDGKLCGPCLDDFVATPSIRGWHVERAV